MTDLSRPSIRELALRQRFSLSNASSNRDWFAAPDNSLRIELAYGGDGRGRVVSAVVIPGTGHTYALAPDAVPAELVRIGIWLSGPPR